MPILPFGDEPVNTGSGTLSLNVNGVKQELPLVLLYAEYGRLKEDEDKEKFLGHVLETYILKGQEVPVGVDGFGSLEAHEGKLMPLAVSEAWLKEKSQGLPQDVSLPSLNLEGTPGNTDGLAVVSIFDFGEGCAPVTTTHLQMWNVGLTEVLRIALGNLINKTVSKEWHGHMTGSASTTWCDGYDTTRALLMPNIVLDDAMNVCRGPDTPSVANGDPVAVFCTQNQTLVAEATNPVGLCFVGEMTLDVVQKHPHEQLCTVPFRLQSGEGPSLLTVLNSPVQGVRWVPYIPSGTEFAVPRTQAECDAILDGLQAGEIPVFRHSGEAEPSDSGATAQAEREAGNACFRKKQWAQALEHYTKAIALSSVADQHVPRANRAAVYLELKQYDAALQDCDAVLQEHPNHAKALYRRGLAHQALSDFDRALADFQRLKVADAGQSGFADAQIDKVQELRRKGDVSSDWAAQVTASMLSPKPADALPVLLTAAVGWSVEVDANRGVPGWMPQAVKETSAAKSAALQLYAMLRDDGCTKRDAAAQSAYTQTPGASLPKMAPGRRAVLEKLSSLAGERSLVILSMANRECFTEERCFNLPLEERSLCQILGCIASTREIKMATEEFSRGAQMDAQFQELLKDPSFHF